MLRKFACLFVFVALLALPSLSRAANLAGVSTGYTCSTTSGATVTVALNQARRKLLCSNVGGNVVYLHLDTAASPAAATSTNGYYLAANGGQLSLPDGSEPAPTGAVLCVTTAATSTLVCIEY